MLSWVFLSFRSIGKIVFVICSLPYYLFSFPSFSIHCVKRLLLLVEISDLDNASKCTTN